MAFTDPNFEQHRLSVVGGKPVSNTPVVSSGKISDPIFEARRTQVMNQKTVSTPTPVKTAPTVSPTKSNLIQDATKGITNIVKKISDNIKFTFTAPKLSPRLPDSAFPSTPVIPQKPVTIKPGDTKVDLNQIKQSAGEFVDRAVNKIANAEQSVFGIKLGTLGKNLSDLGAILSGASILPETYKEYNKLDPWSKLNEATKVFGALPPMAALKVPMGIEGAKDVASFVRGLIGGYGAGSVLNFAAQEPGKRSVLEAIKPNLNNMLFSYFTGLTGLPNPFEFLKKTPDISKAEYIKSRDFLKDLGVKEEVFSKPDALKKSYFDLAKKYHPDIPGTGNAEIFKNLNKAFKTVTDTFYDVQKTGDKQPMAGLLEDGEHTPQEVIGKVIKDGQENTPIGKEIIKAATEAQKNGQNIIVEQTQPSVDNKLKVGVGIKTAEKLGMDVKSKGHILDTMPKNKQIETLKINSNLLGNKIKLDLRDLLKQTTGKLTSNYWLKKIQGGERPPILVGIEDNQLKIIDGNHRATAYVQEKINDVPVIFTNEALTKFNNSQAEGEGKSLTIPGIEEASKYTSSKDFADAIYSAKPTDQIGHLPSDQITARDSTNEEGVQSYVDKIKAGESIDPVEVTKQNGKFVTTDGSHRVTAYKLLNQPIPVIYRGEGKVAGLKTFEEIYKVAKPSPPLSPTEKPIVEQPQKEGRGVEVEKGRGVKKIYYRGSKEKTLLKSSIGIYLTPDKKYANVFAGKTGIIEKFTVSLENIWKLKYKIGEYLGQPGQDVRLGDELIEGAENYKWAIDDIKKKGYDAIESSDGRQLLVFDKNKVFSLQKPVEKKLIKKEQPIKQKPSENLGFNPKNLEEPSSPTATKEVDKIIKKSEIAKQLSEKLGVPIRRGKFRAMGSLGIFKPGQKVVRIKSGGLQTVFHEVGHFLDDKFKLSESIDKKERKALMVEYGINYDSQPRRQQQEAFAEFLRFMMTGQEAKAKSFAPKFMFTWEMKMNELPEIKEVIDTATIDFKRWNDQPAVAKILSHISIGAENKQSLTNWASQKLHDFYTAAKDDLHPLSEFSALAKKQGVKLPAERDPYILARNLRGWTGKAELFLNKGTFGKEFWKVENGKTKMNFKGPGYTDIMKPVEKAGKLDEFRVYIVARRAIELMSRETPIKTGININDAKTAVAELEKANPEFKKVAEDRLKYKDQLLEFLKDNGVIGEKSLKKIKELNKFHVPFYRVMEEMQGTRFMGRTKFAGNLSSPIKKIKGSEREIIDPLESDIKDTYAFINAAERNNIGVAMANIASQNFELGRLFEKVDRPMKGVTVNAMEVMEKAVKEMERGIPVPDELAEIVVTIFRPTQDRGANMLNVNMGDKQEVFQVDPDLFKAIQGLNAEDIGMIARIFSFPAKLLRAGATLTPDFSMRNPIKDQFSAFVYSKYGFIPGFDLIRGMFEVFKKGDVYNLWKAGGGEHSMMVSMDRDYLQKNLKDLFKNTSQEVMSFFKNPLKGLQIISEFGEQATRLGEMKRALEHQANPIAGAFASREVTLDFSRIGAKTKAWNGQVAFWNANVEGSDKMVKSFREAPFRTAWKILLSITLPSILLYMANRDDGRWKEIPAWQKDLFWIIMPKHISQEEWLNKSESQRKEELKLINMLKYGIYRIPKPFEVGVLFGSVPERILEFMDNKNPEIFKQLESSIQNGATPGFIPTWLLPIIENISNYSFFQDRPIVPQGKQNLPAEAQYGNYTTETSKVIGKALNYSPSKVDNLIQGYTGGLGKYATQIIDSALIGTGVVKVPAKPAQSFNSLPVIKAFTIREPVGSGSESVNQVYNKYGKIGGEMSYIRNLVNDGRINEAKKYIKSHKEVINYPLLSGAVSSFSDISSARDIIANSEKLTPEQKKTKINRLDQLQTKLAQKVLEQLKK